MTGLGTVSDRQLDRALRRLGLGDLVAAVPVDCGHFGQNLYLTSTIGRYVLRGSPLFPWQFATEKFHVDLLHHRSRCPVPWPYLVDPGTDIFGWSYAVMPRLPGRPLSDADPLGGLTERDRHQVAGALAEALAEVHSVSAEHPGRYRAGAGTVVRFDLASELAWPSRQPTGTGGPPISWRTRVEERTRHKLRTAAQVNARTATAADLTWTDGHLERVGHALDVPFEAVLVWEDFKPGNVLVAREDGQWRVSGLVDPLEAYFGDGEADLPRTVCALLDHDVAVAETFLREYAARRPLRPGFTERFTAYLLLDRALLWYFFSRHSLCYWPEHWTFRDWAGRYVDLAEPVLPRSPA